MSIPQAHPSPADADATPQAGSTPSTGTDTPQAGTHDDLTPAQLRAELAAARKDAAKYRADLRKHETEAERKAQAELSEVERLRQELSARDEQLTQAQQRERRHTLREAAEQALTKERLDLTLPVGDLIRLIDNDRIEWDEDGTPQNIGTLIKDYVATRPKLVERRGSVDGGAGGETRPLGGRFTDQILSRSRK